MWRARTVLRMNNTLDDWITVQHGKPVKPAGQAGGSGAMRGAACVQAPPRGASAPQAAPLLAQAAGGAGAQDVELSDIAARNMLDPNRDMYKDRKPTGSSTVQQLAEELGVTIFTNRGGGRLPAPCGGVLP